MNFKEYTEKVEWEVDMDDMGERPEAGESKDGRFSIQPNYYDRDNAQDFTLHDSQTKAKQRVDTFSQAKKLAEEWVINPPPTPEQIRVRDLAHRYTRKSVADRNAKKYNADLISNSDGTFSLIPRNEF